MVSFNSIAFVVVKLQIFKIFHTDSACMKWFFFGVFGLLLPQTLVDYVKIFTRGSL